MGERQRRSPRYPFILYVSPFFLKGWLWTCTSFGAMDVQCRLSSSQSSLSDPTGRLISLDHNKIEDQYVQCCRRCRRACARSARVTACRARARCARAGARCRRWRAWRRSWRARRRAPRRSSRAGAARAAPAPSCATSRPAPIIVNPILPLARLARMAGMYTIYLPQKEKQNLYRTTLLSGCPSVTMISITLECIKLKL